MARSGRPVAVTDEFDVIVEPHRLVPASYQVTARSVSRVHGDGRSQSDRSLKGHEAGVQKGQPRAANHHRKIVAVYEIEFRGSGSFRREDLVLGVALPQQASDPAWVLRFP